MEIPVGYENQRSESRFLTWKNEREPGLIRLDVTTNCWKMLYRRRFKILHGALKSTQGMTGLQNRDENKYPKISLKFGIT